MPGFLSWLASHPWRPAHQRNPFLLPRAITLENTLVILSTVAPDAGRYYVQAVNDKNGDNKTSQPITLAVESKSATGPGPTARRVIKSWEWGSWGSWGRWNGVEAGKGKGRSHPEEEESQLQWKREPANQEETELDSIPMSLRSYQEQGHLAWLLAGPPGHPGKA